MVWSKAVTNSRYPTDVFQWVYRAGAECCLLVRSVAFRVKTDVFVQIAGVPKGPEAELTFQRLVARVRSGTDTVAGHVIGLQCIV
jgi:hypothetical protein